MHPIRICRKCNKENCYDEVHQKWVCRPCKAKYAREWRKKNPGKVKSQNIQQRDKRKAFVSERKLIDPNRFKRKIEAKKFCEKHQQDHVMTSDMGWVCKECRRIAAAKHRIYKNTSLQRRLKRFELTEEKYKALLSKNDGKCHICNQPETQKVKGKIIEIAIDHCHEAEKKGEMKVRGLLCRSCNNSLGGFKDSIALLQSAITYLKSFEVQS